MVFSKNNVSLTMYCLSRIFFVKDIDTILFEYSKKTNNVQNIYEIFTKDIQSLRKPFNLILLLILAFIANLFLFKIDVLSINSVFIIIFTGIIFYLSYVALHIITNIVIDVIRKTIIRYYLKQQDL